MFTLHTSQHNRNIQRTNVQFLAGAATLRFNFSTLDVTCMVVYTRSTPPYFALTCNKKCAMRTCSYFCYYSFNSVSSELADSGAWFGDPASHAREGKKIWVAGDDLKTRLDRAVGTKNPDALALALLSILFTREEIAGGNVTPPRTRAAVMLNSKKIGAIQCKLITLVVSSYLYLGNTLAIFHTTHCTCPFPNAWSQVMSTTSFLNLIQQLKKPDGARYRRRWTINAEIQKRL